MIILALKSTKSVDILLPAAAVKILFILQSKSTMEITSSVGEFSLSHSAKVLVEEETDSHLSTRDNLYQMFSILFDFIPVRNSRRTGTGEAAMN